MPCGLQAAKRSSMAARSASASGAPPAEVAHALRTWANAPVDARPVADHGGSAEGHVRDALCLGPLARAPRRLEAAHAGQVDIHDDSTGLARANQFDADLGRGRGDEVDAIEVGDEVLHERNDRSVLDVHEPAAFVRPEAQIVRRRRMASPGMGGVGPGTHVAEPRDMPNDDLTWIDGSGRSGRRESRAFLAGPAGRLAELRHAVNIVRDLVRGCRTLHFVGPCVTVLGASRSPEGGSVCQLARAVGGTMARAGLTVMTDGGSGVAEAASRGAREAGGATVGCTIASSGSATTPYLDRELRLRHSLVRATLMTKYSVGLVALPGGFATLDAVFGALAMSMRGDLRDFPIVLMGERYWRPIVDEIESSVARTVPLDGAGQQLLLVSDSANEATSFVLRHAIHRFGTKLQPGRARRILGERSLRGHADRSHYRPRVLRPRGFRSRPPERNTP